MFQQVTNKSIEVAAPLDDTDSSMERNTDNKIVFSLNDFNFDSETGCEIFKSFLENEHLFVVTNDDAKNINRLFLYAIEHQNKNIFNWCLTRDYVFHINK